MKETVNRKEIARRRVKGLIIFLIVVFSCVLFYDAYLLFKGWF